MRYVFFPIFPNSYFYFILIGEPLTRNILNTWKTHPARLIVRYGATELATACVENVIQNHISYDTTLVGKILGPSSAIILDENLNVSPKGCIGELCISGPQIARGYLNDITKTSKSFIQWNGVRLYRTGDFARMNPDLSLSIVGRKDAQKKLNGLRYSIIMNQLIIQFLFYLKPLL
jgi:ferricrocin synthase